MIKSIMRKSDICFHLKCLNENKQDRYWVKFQDIQDKTKILKASREKKKHIK